METPPQQEGVAFPTDDSGRRSTSALGQAVVTDALREVDPAGALAAERDTSWRSGYLRHFRQLTVAGLTTPDAGVTIARDGLDSLHRRMRVVGADGADAPLSTLADAAPRRTLRTTAIEGGAEPLTELSVPYRGDRLTGDALQRRLDRWVDDGIIQPSCAEAIREVMAHPEWLRLPDHTVVVLGAGAEMGPLPALLRWGATVAGIDLPRPGIWERVIGTARKGAGTLLLPTPTDVTATTPDDDLAVAAGLDLVSEVPEAAAWIAELPGTPVLGGYAYADGADHVRVSMAVDALMCRVQASQPDAGLAFLATPTDVFVVPADEVARSTAAYQGRSATAKLLGRPLRTISGGRLMRRAYAQGVDPGICDALVPQQGPNYALAKRLQRWRATVARAEGTTVSLHVAPATRTRSVLKNRALAAAYAGAHRFGVEIFDPATTNTLMAALLVHDLHTGGGPTHEHPWQDEAHAAAHGGLWTSPYAPRSVLGLAAVLGLGSARS